MNEMDGVQATLRLEKRTSIKGSDIAALHADLATIRKNRPNDDLPSTDAAIVWERVSNGYRIVDLQLDRFMQALYFTNYCQTEPLCEAVGLFNDAGSVKLFMNIVFKKMENMMSFIALQEGTNNLVGVLVASFFDKSGLSVSKEKGETLHQVMLFKGHAIAEVNFYEATGSEKPVHIDILCVHSDHQRKGIGTALLRSCIARASRVASACVGEFTSCAGQLIARRLEFEELYELPYVCSGAVDNRFQAFEICHPENYSIACMGLRVSPPQYQLPIVPEPVATKKSPNQEKRAKKRKRAKK